jgi:hypothetical protein
MRRFWLFLCAGEVMKFYALIPFFFFPSSRFVFSLSSGSIPRFVSTGIIMAFGREGDGTYETTFHKCSILWELGRSWRRQLNLEWSETQVRRRGLIRVFDRKVIWRQLLSHTQSALMFTKVWLVRVPRVVAEMAHGYYLFSIKSIAWNANVRFKVHGYTCSWWA